ncbi:hexokinase [Streptomyces ambofaciens]
MSEQTTANSQPYPGRDDLNKAQARARRAFARAYKEGMRFDKTLVPEVARLVAEATETLNRIAADAEQLEESSARHQRALKAKTDKVRASLRKMQRIGGVRGAQATEMLAKLDARAAAHGRPANG